MSAASAAHNFMSVLVLYLIGANGDHPKNGTLIYILMWMPSQWIPFPYLGSGSKTYIDELCTYQNCFLTDDHMYFDDIFDYDVILFNTFTLYAKDYVVPPQKRPGQVYILASVESAGQFPMPKKFQGFFDHVWLYKFTSEIVVTDKEGFEVAPEMDTHWINIREMNETSEDVLDKLQSKYTAAVWMGSNCYPKQRYEFVRELQRELSMYGHRLDIYGLCGDRMCPKADHCHDLIESDYYFYLAFENFDDQDFVTETLLNALQHYAVPVVYGGANYSEYMPNGIYLDAIALGPQVLAQRMVMIINNQNTYYDFFRWHGYYSFHRNEGLYARELCALCEFLNGKIRPTDSSIIDDEEKYYALSTDVDESFALPAEMAERYVLFD